MTVPPAAVPDEGRPRCAKADAIARELLSAYVTLTGTPGQGFIPLVRQTFAVLGIKASAKWAAEQAERWQNEFLLTLSPPSQGVPKPRVKASSKTASEAAER